MKINVELTKNAKQKPSLENIGFGKHFTDHMFVMEYEEGKGWYQASVVPYAPLSLDPSSMVLHYGQAVFEGMKCYHADDGRLLLFRPEKNCERLNNSHARLCIPQIDPAVTLEAIMKLIEVDKDWVPKWEGTSLYVRPFTLATEAGLGVHPSHTYKFIVILSPSGAYYPEGINPVKICIENEYVRAVRGGTGFTKAAANYAISLKGQVAANEMGFTQVLWLDGVERKYVEEVGTMNVFFKINNEIITPPLDEGSILGGVTRDSVMTLLRDWGYTVSERKIGVKEIFDAHAEGKLEEAFGTGTAAVISPMGELNWNGKNIVVADNKIGPLSGRLYDELTGIQYGRKPDPHNWVREVK